MDSDEEGLLRAVVAAPEDEAVRLVYADYLDERADPRAEFLRAEVEYFRAGPGEGGVPDLAELADRDDPVWARRVARAPFAILVPGLTFSECGPPITAADLAPLEASWGPLPPDYAAFLLNFNGGVPSRPCLYSYFDETDEYAAEDIYDAVEFYSTAARHSDGFAFHQLSVFDLLGRRIYQGLKTEDFARLLPLGWIDLHDDDGGATGVVALRTGDDGEFERVVTVEYNPAQGMYWGEDVHWQPDFTSFLMSLVG